VEAVTLPWQFNVKDIYYIYFIKDIKEKKYRLADFHCLPNSSSGGVIWNYRIGK
jgi:hypothetical protein